MTNFKIGDRVRFSRTYSLGMPADFADEAPTVEAGTVGEVVACYDTKLWIQVEGLPAPVTVWFPEYLSHEAATTAVLERLQDERS